MLNQLGTKEKSSLQSSFAIFTTETDTLVDYCWFRGGWWDPLTMAWNTIKEGKTKSNEPVDKNAPGASLFVPFSLMPGKAKTIRLMMAWYSPESDLHIGEIVPKDKNDCNPDSGCCSSPADLDISNGMQSPSGRYKPWYCSQFENIEAVADYCTKHYDELRKKTELFTQAFYASTLPPEVMEAVAANLTIIKSPTVMRQYDGRLWSWEGCGDSGGCCHGSCTHVWNYAQAIPHLFPALERTLRHTEFCENQNAEGHQGSGLICLSAHSSMIFMQRQMARLVVS